MDLINHEKEFAEILNSLLEECQIDQMSINRFDLINYLNESKKFSVRFYEDISFFELYLKYYNSLSLYKRGSADKYFLDNFYNRPLSQDTSLYVGDSTNQFNVVKDLSNSLLKLNDKIDLEYEISVRNDFSEVKQIFEKIELPKETWLSLTGSKNVKNFTERASEVYSVYKSVIEGYKATKFSILQAIDEYTQLRQQLSYERDDLIQILKDSYGNAALESYPQLFDFNKIEWLDIESMFNDLDTQFEKILGKYEAFEDQANQNFKNIQNQIDASFNNVYKSLNKTKIKKDKVGSKLLEEAVKVAIVGIENIINTRVASKEKCLEIKRDIEFMKLSFAPDYQKILIDLGRLFEIYTNIKKIFIPLVECYSENFSKIINGELKELINSYRSFQDSSEFKNREKLIIEKRNNESNIVEHHKSLARCEQEFDDTQTRLINEIKPIYDVYKKEEPQKPNFLFSLLSLGINNYYYSYSVDIWSKNFMPVEEGYNWFTNKANTLQVDIEHYKNRITVLENKNEELVLEISNMSDALQKLFNEEGPMLVISKINPSNINTILSLSKDILEKGLRDNLIDPVSYLSKLTFVKQVNSTNNYDTNNLISHKVNKLGDKLFDLNNFTAILRDTFANNILSSQLFNNLNNSIKSEIIKKIDYTFEKINLIQERDESFINLIMADFINKEAATFLPDPYQEPAVKDSLLSLIANCSNSWLKQVRYIDEIRKLKSLNKTNDEILAQLNLNLTNHSKKSLDDEETENLKYINLIKETFKNF